VKRAILITILLGLVILLPTAWLLNTESGLRWVYQQLQTRLPTQLQLQQLEGTLGDTITLRGIEYSDGELDFSADQLVLQWNPWALLAGQIEIISLDLKQVRIELAASSGGATDVADDVTLPQLKLPLQVILQHASSDLIALRQGDNSLQLQDLLLQSEADSSAISIARLELRITEIVIQGQRQNDIEANLAGRVEAADDYRHDLQFGWQTRLPAGNIIENKVRLLGDLESTRLTQQSTGPLVADLTLDLRQPLRQLQWQGSLVVTDLDTTLLDKGLPVLRGSLKLSANGDLQSAQISGEIEADSAELGRFDTHFELHSLAAERRFDGLQIESLRLAWLDGTFDTRGQLLWAPALSWDSEIEIRNVNPAGLMADWPGDLSARLHSAGRMEAGEIIASATISESSGKLRDYPFSLQGAAHWQDNTLEITSADLKSGASRILTEGRIGNRLDLQWSLDSRDLAELYPQASGQLVASGQLGGTRDKPFVEAEFKGQSLQISDYTAARIEGDIAIDLFSWQKLDLHIAAHDMVLQGQPLQSLELSADGKHIDATLLADQLSARVQLAGELGDQSWRGQLLGADLVSPEFGSWRLQQAVKLDLSAQAIDSETLCLLSSDEAQICASAHQRDFDWDIDLELTRLPLKLLQTWTPPGLELDGVLDAVADLRFTAAGELFGKLDARLPQSSARYPLQEGQPERFEYRLGTIEMALDKERIKAIVALTLENGDTLEGWLELPGARILEIDSERQSLRAAAKVDARNWVIVDAMIPQIRDLRGSLNLDLTADGNLAQPGIQGTARLRDAGFRLQDLDLGIEKIELNASSDGSAKIEFDASGALANGIITLRGNTTLDQQQGWPSRLSVHASDLQIAQLLAPWIVQPLSVDGQLAADAELTYLAPDKLYGEIKISAPAGALNYPLVEQDIESWPFRDGLVSVTLSERGIDADSVIKVGNNSSIAAGMELTGARLLSLDLEHQILKASARVNFDELELIEFVVPEIDQVQGQLLFDISAGGTLAQPLLRAQAQIPQASFRIPRLGLQIRQIQMQGNSDEFNRFNFSLSAVSGTGNLAIAGNTELDRSKGWPTNLGVKGNDFEISRIPEALVTVSPDLQILLQHRSINITGDLKLPYARLQPKDISTATRVSSDTVIIGSEQAPQEKWLVTTRVNLSLGERVTFFGFGFEGRLGGGLLVEDEPGQLSIGTGEITIREGRYRAYGQRLDIDNGRLLFTGNTLDNPGLDIRGIREIGDITVGLQVRGRLQQPEIELFSNPAMGQTDMLSYLLLGRPMEGATGTEGEMMAEAALALGLAGGDTLARQLGDQFGLDEVRVESSNSGDQASLVVGRYLSPKLYVSYGVGLIESINTLNLRYELTERWKVEAESGEYQGADLLFSIER
jgi:autotransporter translocation and assembly factor TamB